MTGGKNREAVETLPLAARDALAGLLTDALACAQRRPALVAALATVTGRGGPSAGREARVHAVLDAAGVRPGVSWAPVAAARLRAYVDVVEEAPAGAGLGARLGQARILFGAGLFFEVHEVLEPAWLAAPGDARRWLQGLIQAAVAWHHWRAGNRRGAATLAVAAGDKLRDVPPEWCGFPAAEVASAIGSWALWLTGGQVDDPPALPLSRPAGPSGPAP